MKDAHAKKFDGACEALKPYCSRVGTTVQALSFCEEACVLQWVYE